ncbi:MULTISPECIES: twin-arginine translocation signal domain-containing protein [Anoxybacillus]|nr:MULTISPECIES: twin-arginine translocation signal domain-containing protein [Anoxybacillus]
MSEKISRRTFLKRSTVASATAGILLQQKHQDMLKQTNQKKAR